MALGRSLRVSLALVMVATSVATAARATETVASDASSKGSTRRAVALVVANLGLIGFATGVVLSREKSSHEATARCSVDVCSSMATLFIEDARSSSNTAFRLLGAGALAMAGGVTLYLTSSPAKPKHASESAAGVALGPGGIMFKTTF